ncbi:MAG: VOC family protein, partial [Pseudomonadota bacterium]
MNWTLHHVNVPAHDVRASARFYADILGMAEAPWVFPPNPRVVSRDADRLTLFPTATGALGPNPGLHIVKPDPGFAHAQGFVHNPTIGGHIAYQTRDLAPVIARIERAGLAYTAPGVAAIPGIHQVYLFDPSMNLVEMNAPLDPDSEAPTGPSTAPWRIHHVNVPAHDVRESAAFYSEIFAMEEAAWTFPPDRGAVSADPAKLTLFPTDTTARGANPGLHLIKPDARFSVDNGIDHNPSIGGHVAYQVPSLDH